MVDGTGLENQQINVSQVRILSLPPKKDPLGSLFNVHSLVLDVFSYHCVCDYYSDSASQPV